MFSTGPAHPAAKPNPQPRQAARHGPENGGDDRDRTGDPLLAKQVLSQLSYAPARLQPGGTGLQRHGSQAVGRLQRFGGPGRI